MLMSVYSNRTFSLLLWSDLLSRAKIRSQNIFSGVRAEPETEPIEPIQYSENTTILPELAELYQQNNDLVGWIRVEDTNINYPVMQTVDNPNFYLKRGFDKEYTDYGCPYVQEDCDVQAPSDNVVIYGHHMVSYIQSE